MTIEQQTISDFLEAVASREPTPGGGAVASIIAALAAALGQMVVNFSVGKKRLSEFDAVHQQALKSLQEHRMRALHLAEEDARAYQRLSKLLKMDKADPRRVSELSQAVEAAINAPHALLHVCMEMLRVLADLSGKTSRALDSDLAMAAILSEAGARSAVWNVRINLPLLEDASVRAAFTQTTASSLGIASDLVRRIERACANV
jgi:formiminotetrahydrofolate cyclodeaminase